MTVRIQRAPAPPGRRGVSLVETLVAFSALTLGLLALLALIDNARLINARNSDQLRAVALARSRLTVLRAAGFRAVLADAAATTPTLPLRAARPVPEDDRFLWTLELAPMEAAIPARRATVAIYRDEATPGSMEPRPMPPPVQALFRLSGLILDDAGQKGPSPDGP